MTTPNSGRVPAWVQPLRRPAAKAPFSPPPDRASQGARDAIAASPRKVLNAAGSSPGSRTAAGSPSGRAAASSSAVKPARTVERCRSATVPARAGPVAARANVAITAPASRRRLISRDMSVDPPPPASSGERQARAHVPCRARETAGEGRKSVDRARNSRATGIRDASPARIMSTIRRRDGAVRAILLDWERRDRQATTCSRRAKTDRGPAGSGVHACGRASFRERARDRPSSRPTFCRDARPFTAAPRLH